MAGSIDKAAWTSFIIETIVSSNLLHNESKKRINVDRKKIDEENDAMSDQNYFS